MLLEIHRQALELTVQPAHDLQNFEATREVVATAAVAISGQPRFSGRVEWETCGPFVCADTQRLILRGSECEVSKVICS